MDSQDVSYIRDMDSVTVYETDTLPVIMAMRTRQMPDGETDTTTGESHRIMTDWELHGNPRHFSQDAHLTETILREFAAERVAQGDAEDDHSLSVSSDSSSRDSDDESTISRTLGSEDTWSEEEEGSIGSFEVPDGEGEEEIADEQPVPVLLVALGTAEDPIDLVSVDNRRKRSREIDQVERSIRQRQPDMPIVHDLVTPQTCIMCRITNADGEDSNTFWWTNGCCSATWCPECINTQWQAIRTSTTHFAPCPHCSVGIILDTV
jgi:hypothetical protein